MDIIPAVGRKAKHVTDDEIREVQNWPFSELLDERDKAALEYTEETSRTPVRVSDELFSRLREHFDDDQIVELTAAIAYENYRARFNHALGMESEDFLNTE